MEVLAITNLRAHAAVLDRVVKILAGGDWLAVPTECGYRLAVRGDGDAAARWARRWGWPEERPWSLLAEDRAQAQEHVRLGEEEQRLLDFFWPGPLVLLARQREGARLEANSRWHKLAVRCPNHPLALELLRRCRFPVVSRSLRDDRGSCFTVAERLAGYLRGIRAPELLEAGQVLQGSAPCLALEPTMVELAAGGARVLRRGFIGTSDLGPWLSGPVLLSYEGPDQRERATATSVTLILVEGEVGRVARRLKTLLESSTEPTLLFISQETADLIGETAVPVRCLGPRHSAEHETRLRLAWRELATAKRPLTALMEGMSREGSAAQLMEQLERGARHVINTEDPGYSGLRLSD